MFYFAKVLISSLIILTSTEVARRNPGLGGLILALPLISIISFAIMGYQGATPETLSNYAKSTLIFVPVSLIFFLPFALPVFREWSFMLKFLSGLTSLTCLNLLLMKAKIL